MLVCLIGSCSFLTKDRKGVDPNGTKGGEELEGVDRRETIFRLCCMRKEYIDKRKNKRKQKLRRKESEGKILENPKFVLDHAYKLCTQGNKLMLCLNLRHIP